MPFSIFRQNNILIPMNIYEANILVTKQTRDSNLFQARFSISTCLRDLLGTSRALFS